MSFQHDAKRTSRVLFTLYVTVCYLMMLAPVVTAGSCACPSCFQRDAVQRCACCVYRQYGKRATQAVDVYPGLEAAFEKEQPVIAEGDTGWSDLDDDSDNNKNILPRINQGSHFQDERLRSRFNSKRTLNSYQGRFFARGPLNHSGSRKHRQETDLDSHLMDVLDEIDPNTRNLLKSSQIAQPSPFLNSYRFMPEVKAGQGAKGHNLVPLKYGLIELVRGL